MAKNIIKVSVKKSAIEAVSAKVDLLAIGLTSDSKRLPTILKDINKKLSGGIDEVRKVGDFKATDGSSALLYSCGKIAAKRILLVGLGEKKEITLDTIRKAAAMAANKAVELNCKTLAVLLTQDSGKKLESARLGQAITEGSYFGSYRYDEYITDCEKSRPKQLNVTIHDDVTPSGIKLGSIVSQAQSYARTIANRPGNVINPVSLALEAKKMARQTPGLSCTVFDDKKLKEIGAGGILAVGAGSASKPRMIVLKYKAPVKSGKKPAKVALVGKAVTFDSGGISIKPSAGMEEMKFDKSGGIAVLGAMKAIAGVKPAVDVYGIIPSAENMPGGSSYRPGDIITTLSGKTVEINNTDAEGRMILCDGIHYAVTQKCDTIIDIATLTGACVVALGKTMAGVMGSDDKLIAQLKQASEATGEKIWHLPCDDDFLEQMKSKVADLKNTGSRWGGASTAAAFLREFTAGTSWAHIDMAGMDMFAGNRKLTGPGSAGFGVRLLTEWAMRQ